MKDYNSMVRQCVRTAAAVISSGKATTRRFDNCFEWSGADAVAAELYRRTVARPDTKLARNLFRYLDRAAVMSSVEREGGAA